MRDEAKDENVPQISNDVWMMYRERCHLKIGVPPPQREEATREQPAALHSFPCADFAMFGACGNRIQRCVKLTGFVLGSGGVLRCRWCRRLERVVLCLSYRSDKAHPGDLGHVRSILFSRRALRKEACEVCMATGRFVPELDISPEKLSFAPSGFASLRQHCPQSRRTLGRLFRKVGGRGQVPEHPA